MKTLLRSSELSCPSCVTKIEKRLNDMEGVERATVHFNTGKIEVEHDESTTRPEDLIGAVRDAGYESRVARM